jgi:hypothetical protein
LEGKLLAGIDLVVVVVVGVVPALLDAGKAEELVVVVVLFGDSVE